MMIIERIRYLLAFLAKRVALLIVVGLPFWWFLTELAECTGIKEPYIRRRLMVLDLPKKMLSTWDRGDIRFGHLEQLARMDDKLQRMSVFDGIMQDRRHRPVTVAELKRRNERLSPALKGARFDPEAEGCLACIQNTSVQIRLFDPGDGDPRCNKPKCFREKQREHLTILHINGESYHDRACFGDQACFNAVRSHKTKTTGTCDPKPKDGPRVTWHGEHFREVFFQQQLPVRFETVPAGSLTSRKLVLYAMLKGNEKARDDFYRRQQAGEPLFDGGPIAMDRQRPQVLEEPTDCKGPASL